MSENTNLGCQIRKCSIQKIKVEKLSMNYLRTSQNRACYPKVEPGGDIGRNLVLVKLRMINLMIKI